MAEMTCPMCGEEMDSLAACPYCGYMDSLLFQEPDWRDVEALQKRRGLSFIEAYMELAYPGLHATPGG
jgi:hypothetical protein